MARRSPLFASFLALLVLLVSGTGAPALADSHEQDAALLKYRQAVMSTIGTNMGAISDILKNGLALPGAVENHANQMATAAALVGPAFEKKIVDGPTDAKPEIWADWARFQAAITDYENAARTLASAAASGDGSAVGKAVRGLGKSCGGCHKPFRKKKEDSYKNR